jgi:WD40 repeat protein
MRSEGLSGPTAAKGKLYATTSYKGHAESVYTLAYDPVYNQLVSAGKDSCILLWDAHGNVAAR